MLQIVLLLLLASSSTMSSTVQTSLCCCGCTMEPCPQVGATCSPPQQQCRTSADLNCSDLQKLWDDSRGKEISEKNSTDEKIGIALPSQNTGSLNQVRLVTNDGLTILETGQGGRTEWREVVSTLRPAIIPQLMFNPVLFQDDTILRATKSSGLDSAKGPTALKSVVAEMSISSSNATVENDRPTFEKLEAMIIELQEMVKQLKENVLLRANERSDVSLQGEAAPSMDSAADDLEKRAIDDVIARMRRSFARTVEQSSPVNQVDSSIGVSSVQSPLRYIPAHIRVSRASNDPSSGDAPNCNDLRLKELVIKNIGETAQKSKRAIQKAAEAELGGTYDVICSPCEFSFVISSQKYCDGFKDQIACFAFLQPPTTLVPK